MSLKTYLKDFLKRRGYALKRLDSRPAYLERMYERIEKVKGDVVECGVGKIGTFKILASLVEKEGAHRTLWGFDSFEGFPEPSPEDASLRNPKKGEWKSLEAEDVPKFLAISHIDESFIAQRVKVVKGFFQDSLPKNTIGPIALLHLDVDLYDSYKTCLHYLFPKVSQGGVVLFDEYMNLNEQERFPGAKKAIDEYFESSGYKLQRDKLSGKYFLVK